MLQLIEVGGEPERALFHALDERLYGSSRRAATELSLDRELFRERQQLFLAVEGDEPRGRVVARISPELVDDGAPLGLLGFFEALDDSAVASLLLRTATEWLRSRGCRTVAGPMDGDTWHRYRVNAGPYERPPFLLEPVNPPYYAALWQSAGFETLEHYVSKRLDDITPLLPHFERKYEEALRAGFSFRPIQVESLQTELARIHAMSCEIFRGNFLYSEISLDDFLALYRGIEQLLDRELVWFAIAPDGSDAGFFFSYIDIDPRMVNYKTLGVTPAHRRSGIGGALAYCAYKRALAMGRTAANHCLMREGNVSAAMDAGHGAVFRHYYLYRAGAF
jgi:GNAT superfamily N-acetyltransferase